jgi:LAO/AO transport system kinase
MAEDDDQALPQVTAALATGRALVLGRSGHPGWASPPSPARWWPRLQDVASGWVLAVDPSSPYTGGALLGDRIRMPQSAWPSAGPHE